MGIADIRNAFIEAAQNKLTLTACTMSYATVDGVRECQILHFAGSRSSDGTAFSIDSDAVPPQGDLIAAARKAATSYLEANP